MTDENVRSVGADDVAQTPEPVAGSSSRASGRTDPRAASSDCRWLAAPTEAGELAAAMTSSRSRLGPWADHAPAAPAELAPAAERRR